MKQLLLLTTITLLWSCQKDNIKYEKASVVSNATLAPKHKVLQYNNSSVPVAWTSEDVWIEDNTPSVVSDLPGIFLGSSTFTTAFWPTLTTDFKDYNPVQMGYGGKTWGHMMTYVKTLPKAQFIVIGCGENDWYAKIDRPSIRFDVGDYVYRVRGAIDTAIKHNPGVPIIVVECKKTPVLKSLWDKIDQGNTQVKNLLLSRSSKNKWVEVNKDILPEDYRSDGMHLYPGGYAHAMIPNIKSAISQ
jgi:hypothetical protein